jgi:hypothetical protein
VKGNAIVYLTKKTVGRWNNNIKMAPKETE